MAEQFAAADRRGGDEPSQPRGLIATVMRPACHAPRSRASSISRTGLEYPGKAGDYWINPPFADDDKKTSPSASGGSMFYRVISWRCGLGLGLLAGSCARRRADGAARQHLPDRAVAAVLRRHRSRLFRQTRIEGRARIHRELGTPARRPRQRQRRYRAFGRRQRGRDDRRRQGRLSSSSAAATAAPTSFTFRTTSRILPTFAATPSSSTPPTPPTPCRRKNPAPARPQGRRRLHAQCGRQRLAAPEGADDGQEQCRRHPQPAVFARGRRQGMHSLGRTTDLLGPYQAGGAFVRRAWAREHAETLGNISPPMSKLCAGRSIRRTTPRPSPCWSTNSNCRKTWRKKA